MEKDAPSSSGAFFETRFPARGVRSRFGAILVALLFLFIVAAWFVVWSPGPRSSLTWQQGITNSNTTNAALPVGSAAALRALAGSYSPPAGIPILEDGRHVVYVYFDGGAFIPETITVNAGDSVRFVNASNLSMRVSSRPESLSSVEYSFRTQGQVEGQGGAFDMRLPTPGIWSFENIAVTEPRITGVVYVR